MKSRHLLLSLLLLAPGLVHGAAAAYKITMRDGAQTKQPVVYARVDDHGFGVQYRRDNTATQLGSYAGLAGSILGSMVGGIATRHPTSRAQTDAEKIAAFMDRPAAQQALASSLGEALAGAPLFVDPVKVLELGAGTALDANALGEDPALEVELYATLTADYRALQVTAIVRGLSPVQKDPATLSADPGLVFRNRFDYVSELLPAPHIKTKDQIKLDVAAVKAKYSGRKLTKSERAQYKEELREASAGTTANIWYETLLEQWVADSGSRLRQALQQGVTEVAHLIAKDLLDVAPVEVRSAEQMRRRLPRDSASDRYTSVMVGGPFAGALMSEPGNLNATDCHGIAFGASPTKQQPPRLCP